MQTFGIHPAQSNNSAYLFSGLRAALRRNADRLRRWRIRITAWEYWPINVVYALPGLYFLYCCARARDWFFYVRTNPGIENGGMFFESKWRIFQLLPKGSYPATVYIPESTGMDAVWDAIAKAGLDFPLVAKPDRGERGWGVKIVENEADLAAYHGRFGSAYLLQAYVDLPVELSVFYERMPGEEKGRVTSLTGKAFLAVTGDGTSTLESLLRKSDRAFLQAERLAAVYGNAVQSVPAKGEKVVAERIGNHSRGTTFLNLNSQISPALENTIHGIASQMAGFYYGRFDLRCRSLQSLEKGEEFRILEVNGASAEPAHIYDPGFGFIQGQLVLMRHFRTMQRISTANRRRGATGSSWKEFFALRKAQKLYRSKATF